MPNGYQIRSGTDGALALGICNILIAEELYDESSRETGHRALMNSPPMFVISGLRLSKGITGVPGETVMFHLRGALPMRMGHHL